MKPVELLNIERNRYYVSEDGHIYDNGLALSQDLIYHSTNGYDYVLLYDLNGGLSVHRYDFIIYFSLSCDRYDDFSCVDIKHINGDISDCNFSNLVATELLEVWKTVEYPEWVQRDQYEVSNFGRVRNKKTGRILKCANDSKGYPRMIFYIDHKYKQQFVHQLVMNTFTVNVDRDRYNQINHIDGNTENNCIYNLEWADNTINGNHAYWLGLNQRISNISVEEVDLIVDALIESGGSIKGALNLVCEDHPSITYSIIASIKYDKRFMRMRESRYYNKDVQFGKCLVSKITPDELDTIIERLLDPIYCGSVKAVYDSFDHVAFPHITRGIINLIKCKNKSYRKISNRYKLEDIVFPQIYV